MTSPLVDLVSSYSARAPRLTLLLPRFLIRTPHMNHSSSNTGLSNHKLPTDTTTITALEKKEPDYMAWCTALLKTINYLCTQMPSSLTKKFNEHAMKTKKTETPRFTLPLPPPPPPPSHPHPHQPDPKNVWEEESQFELISRTPSVAVGVRARPGMGGQP